MQEEWLSNLASGEFEQRLWRFYRNIHVAIDAMFTPIITVEELSVTQIRILMTVLERGEISVGELSEIIRMNSGNCSTMCKKLEQRGLLQRKRSHEDERIVMLHLQNQGREAIQMVLEAIHQRQNPFLQQLSKADMMEISAGLDRIEQFFHDLAGYLESEKEKGG